MTTQYTSILKLALPVQGELSGTWGDTVNDNITSMVEEAIAGRSVINSWTANSHTLTTADGTTSESRAAMLEFTDTGAALSGNATVICPTASKIYIAKNAVGSSRTVTLKTSAGTGIAIPDGTTMFLFCDGTNVVEAVTNINSFNVGGTVAINAIKDEDDMSSDSATALATQQSIKAYVDSQVGSFDTLAEVLAQGNTSGGTGLTMSSGDDLTLTGASYNAVWDSSDSALEFGDNAKAVFGAGPELQIYSDGTSGIIKDVGAGDIKILADDFYVQNAAGSSTLISVLDTGKVGLGFAGSEKLATTSTGIDVTGTVTADGLTVDGIGSFSSTAPYIDLFETDTTDVNSRIVSNSSSLRLQTVGDNGTGATNRLLIDHTTGDINFYEDTGTTAKLFWDASAESLGIGTTSPENPIHVSNSTATSQILVQGDSNDASIKFNKSGQTFVIGIDATDNSFRVADNTTLGTNDRLVIDSSGNVGIGTTSPTTKLEITGTADAETGITATNSRAGVGYTLLLNNTSNGANEGSGIKWQGGGFDTAAIIGRSDAAAASADAPGYLTFHTSTDGTENLAERMRITSSGDMIIKGGRIFVRENDDENDAVVITRDADEGYVNLYSSGSQTVEIRGNGDSYFNGGNVGINSTTPSERFEIAESANETPAAMSLLSEDTSIAGTQEIGVIYAKGKDSGTESTGAKITFAADGTWDTGTNYYYPTAIKFYTQEASGTDNIAAGPRMAIDSSGNVGIGVIPESDWNSSYHALQVGTTATFMGAASGGEGNWISNNAIFSSSGSWEYLQTSSASSLDMQSSTAPFRFRYAASGTAGAAISWSEAMRIDSSGNVGIGLSSGIASKLHVNTEMSLGADGDNRGIINYSSDILSFGTRQSSTNYFNTIKITGGQVGINRTPSISNSKLEVGGADDVSLINVEASGNTGGIGVGSTGMQFFSGSTKIQTIASDGSTFHDAVTITTGDNTHQLKLISTDADANVGPVLELYRDSASPADDDGLGRIYFYGNNSAGEKIEYGLIRTFVSDVTDATEDSALEIFTYTAGAQASRFRAAFDETVLNESSKDIDFRVESDSNTHMLFVDGGSNVVSVGATPAVTDAVFQVTSNSFPETTEKLVEFTGGFADGNYQTNRYVKLKNSYTGAAYGAPAIVFETNANSSNEKAYGVIHTQSSGAISFQNKPAGSAIAVGTDIASTQRFLLNSDSSGAVFNEQSSDYDFRVESDGNTHMLFVDAGSNHVNIGTSTDHQGVLNVESTDNNYTLMLASTDSDANAGPWLGFDRVSSSPAADDNIGSVAFLGRDSAGSQTQYAEIRSFIQDPTNGSEDGRLKFIINNAGTQRTVLDISGSNAIVFNEDGQDLDFRVESNNNANMLFVDAGNDIVVVGGGTPYTAGKLEVFATTDNSSNGISINGTSSATSFRLYTVGNVAKIGRGGDHPSISIDGTHNVIVNDDSEDHDFRVESDNNSHALFVEAGADAVGILNGSPTSGSSADFQLGFGDRGKMLHNNSGTVANNGTLDLGMNTGGGGYQGILITNNTNKSNAGARTQQVHAVTGRGTDVLFTQLATDNGTSGGASFTLTAPSNGVVRFTNTSGADCAVSMMFFGTTGF